ELTGLPPAYSGNGMLAVSPAETTAPTASAQIKAKYATTHASTPPDMASSDAETIGMIPPPRIVPSWRPTDTPDSLSLGSAKRSGKNLPLTPTDTGCSGAPGIAVARTTRAADAVRRSGKNRKSTSPAANT